MDHTLPAPGEGHSEVCTAASPCCCHQRNTQQGLHPKRYGSNRKSNSRPLPVWHSWPELLPARLAQASYTSQSSPARHSFNGEWSLTGTITSVWGHVTEIINVHFNLLTREADRTENHCSRYTHSIVQQVITASLHFVTIFVTFIFIVTFN